MADANSHEPASSARSQTERRFSSLLTSAAQEVHSSDGKRKEMTHVSDKTPKYCHNDDETTCSSENNSSVFSLITVVSKPRSTSIGENSSSIRPALMTSCSAIPSSPVTTSSSSNHTLSFSNSKIGAIKSLSSSGGEAPLRSSYVYPTQKSIEFSKSSFFPVSPPPPTTSSSTSLFSVSNKHQAFPPPNVPSSAASTPFDSDPSMTTKRNSNLRLGFNQNPNQGCGCLCKSCQNKQSLNGGSSSSGPLNLTQANIQNQQNSHPPHVHHLSSHHGSLKPESVSSSNMTGKSSGGGGLSSSLSTSSPVVALSPSPSSVSSTRAFNSTISGSGVAVPPSSSDATASSQILSRNHPAHHVRSSSQNLINLSQLDQNSSPGSVSSSVVHLYQEIEHLKRTVAEKDYHIVQMETALMNNESRSGDALSSFPDSPSVEFEVVGSRDQESGVRYWQDKYERLMESHRRLQKVNQALEDKLLRVVDKFESDKTALTKDVADLTNKLVEARVLITELEDENDSYKNDCNIAVHLLQCKPSNFVNHKLNSLPMDFQEKVRNHLNSSQPRGKHGHNRCSETNRSGHCNSGGLNNQTGGSSPIQNSSGKVIRVPISTFPPTAMVYSIPENESVSGGSSSSTSCNNKSGEADYVSAAIMAKVLEERSKERNLRSGYRSNQKCTQCRVRRVANQYYDQTTQTPNGVITYDDYMTQYQAFDFKANFYGKTSNHGAKCSSRGPSSNHSSASSVSSTGSSSSSLSCRNVHQPNHQQQQTSSPAVNSNGHKPNSNKSNGNSHHSTNCDVMSGSTLGNNSMTSNENTCGPSLSGSSAASSLGSSSPSGSSPASCNHFVSHQMMTSPSNDPSQHKKGDNNCSSLCNSNNCAGGSMPAANIMRMTSSSQTTAASSNNNGSNHPVANNPYTFYHNQNHLENSCTGVSGRGTSSQHPNYHSHQTATQAQRSNQQYHHHHQPNNNQQMTINNVNASASTQAGASSTPKSLSSSSLNVVAKQTTHETMII